MSVYFADSFLDAFNEGKVCLHPTDSVPGLAFNPISEVGLQHMRDIKGVRSGKSFVCLAPDLDRALSYWLPLPGEWRRVLDRIWPGPVSIIWKARSDLPRSIIHDDGTVCIRVPDLPKEANWLFQVLRKLDVPMPSTSVNCPGEPPKRAWVDAAEFLASREGCFTPKVVAPPSSNKSSTLVKIDESGGYQVLREGPVSESTIRNLVDQEV